jgi:multidrug efflux system outer membrane protein
MAILNGALDTRRESELVEARFNAGLSNELDVAREIELSNAQADLHEVSASATCWKTAWPR